MALILPLRYLPEADSEYLQQVEHYDEQAPGLGRLFVHAIQDAERLVQSNPTGLPLVHGTEDLRCVVVRKFPFRLIYALRGFILIVAVAHTARDPRRFLDR